MTNELKERFFALYWGQNILSTDYGRTVATGKVKELTSVELKLSYLNMKPLSAISDEDAIEVSRVWGCSINSKILGHSVVSRLADGQSQVESQFRNILGVVDFLRSKGYALPYMGISVEEMVKAGWIKLNA